MSNFAVSINKGMTHPQNTPFVSVFRHHLGTSGLLDSAFTKRVYKDGALQVVSCTVASLGNAMYSVTFTPVAAGNYFVDVFETSDTNAHYQEELRADSLQAEISSIPGDVRNLVVEEQGSITLQQALSVMLAVVAGVSQASDESYKTPNGQATRVVAVTNNKNERTQITLTPSS